MSPKTKKHFIFYILYFIIIWTCSKEPTRPVSDNPFDPANPATGGDPFHLQAQIANGGITLTWNKPNIPGLANFRVYRSEQEKSGYAVITTVDGNTTQYVDQTVLNGHIYWYRVSAVNSGNVETNVTNTAAVQIKTDPVLVINGGAQYTTLREVNLTILANTAQQMMISNYSDFQNSQWEAYATSKSWTLLTGEGQKTVYMKVKYDNGSESKVVSDTIEPKLVTNYSFSINNGADTTNTLKVVLTIHADDANQMIISNESNFNNSVWENYIELKEWTLGTGGTTMSGEIAPENGLLLKLSQNPFSTKSYSASVFMKFKNDFEVETNVISNSIVVYINSWIKINNGDPYTSSRAVLLNLFSENADEMIIGNDSCFTGCTWEPYAETKNWNLPVGPGPHLVYVKFRNNSGAVSSLYFDDILPQPMNPEIIIANGAQYTSTREVQLSLSASGSNLMMKIGEDSSFTSISWQSYQSNVNFTLSTGEGTKTVYARFKNDFEIESAVVSSSIILDMTPPVPILSVTPDSGITGETNFQFDPTASSDNLCSISDMQIRFDLENNGSWTGWLNLQITGHQYAVGGGNKTVKMELRDRAGWTAETTVPVYVNTRPVAQFTAIQDQNDILLIHFNASASSDYEDGSNLQFRWDWENDGIWDTEFSDIDTISHQYSTSGNYTVKLEVKDSGNLFNTNTLEVNVGVTCVDIDGNVYQVVKIGNQWWMAENLKVTRYRDGTSIPNITDNTQWQNNTTGAYCSYNNNSANISTYGLLYNWYAVNNAHGLAPAGWHVPSDAEWDTLVNYLGGASVAGGAMKEAGTAHWVSPNTGATNSSGFTALPGGYRYYYGNFYYMGYYAYFWSSTEYSSDLAWHRDVYYNDLQVYRNYYLKCYGFSIRCIRD